MELLVVIGIIALLISILLPSLSKARQSANRLKCMSNLRQIVTSMVGYANSNKGRFPFGARGGAAYDEDWFWWQTSPVAPVAGTTTTFPSPGRAVFDPDQSALAPYLGKMSEKVLRCPSDDASARTKKYPYSYTMNYQMCGNFNYSTTNSNQYRPTITGIRRSSEKILMVEENLTTINDGLWLPPVYDDTGINWLAAGTIINGYKVIGSGNLDLLSINHDLNKAKVDPTGGWAAAGVPLPNPERKGPVGYVDGHADFRPRSYVHSYVHICPDAE